MPLKSRQVNAKTKMCFESLIVKQYFKWLWNYLHSGTSAQKMVFQNVKKCPKNHLNKF